MTDKDEALNAKEMLRARRAGLDPAQQAQPGTRSRMDELYAQVRKSMSKQYLQYRFDMEEIEKSIKGARRSRSAAKAAESERILKEDQGAQRKCCQC